MTTEIEMSEGPPRKIAINHDDYHARHIGRLQDGRQFFVTQLFEPKRDSDNPGCEYIARFIFDPEGNLVDSKIENLGPRENVDAKHARSVYENLLLELGDVTYERIEVAPFEVREDGKSFGLIPREPEDEEDVWAVELLPGNFMAFFQPWDSGYYDT